MFFFCAIWVSFPFLCPLVPRMSLIAEGLSWLSQQYYFQHHDQTTQQLISKLREDVFGNKNWLVEAKQNKEKPKLAKSNWHSQAFGTVSKVRHLPHTLRLTRPLDI